MYKKILSFTIITALLFGMLPVQSINAEGMNGKSSIIREADSSGDASGNASGEASGNASGEASGNASGEASGNASGNASGEASGNASGDAVVTPPDVGDSTIPDGVLTNLSPARAKVVLLDPGHCKVHTGAYGNGLREEVVVLDIAKACQSKLDTYGDVTVYMTRTTGACCQNLKLGDCLSCRNNYAKRLNADFLISMHINAAYDRGKSGANALVAYKSGYNDNVRKETQAFGSIVLKKLKDVGIANRGFLLRKSGSGNRYSNGKTADYYSIVRRGVVFNIPGMIIEHGFITNASDCKKFFSTNAKRTKVGNADADAIISYYNLSNRLMSGKLTVSEDGIYYVFDDGKKALGWMKCEGKWYYFDKKTGKMQMGLLEDEGELYFLDRTTGAMREGWIKDGGVRYLAKGNGSIVRSQIYSDGEYTYLMDEDGKMLGLGLHTVNGKNYYVDYKNHVLSGDLNIDGDHYLFDADTKEMCYGYTKQGSKYYYANTKTGVLSRNKIVKINGASYYFNKSGLRKTGLITYKGAKYYFSPKNGKMVKGWKKINGYYYYFNKNNGKMQKNKWIGKYYVNSKGIRTKKK